MDEDFLEESVIHFENPLVVTHTDATEVPRHPEIALPEHMGFHTPVMVLEDSEAIKQERRRSTLTRTPSPDMGEFVIFEFIKNKSFQNQKNSEKRRRSTVEILESCMKRIRRNGVGSSDYPINDWDPGGNRCSSVRRHLPCTLALPPTI